MRSRASASASLASRTYSRSAPAGDTSAGSSLAGFAITREPVAAVEPAQCELGRADRAEAAREAVLARRQPVREPGRRPERGFGEVGDGAQAQHGARDAVARGRRNQHELLFLGLEALGLEPGTHGGRLHFEPAAQALLAHQPDGARTSRFGFTEQWMFTAKFKRSGRSSSRPLTIHEPPWCHRAHCMQAPAHPVRRRFSQRDFRAHSESLVLVSRPAASYWKHGAGLPADS